MPPSQRPSHSQPSPLIDMDAPISLPPGSSSSRAAQPTPSARLAPHRPSPRSISRIQEQRRTPLPLPRHHLDESDVDRFASLFMPATPPGTPTQPAPPIHEQVKAKICQHRRSHTESSSDSDFGPFVSVPPNQDPLGSAMPTVAVTTATTTTRASESVVAGPTKMGNTSLDYFGQFTTSARAASERNRKGVLDELLAHQDDPMYFLDEDAELRAQTLSPPLLPSVSPASEPVSATPTPRPRSPVSPQPLHVAEMPASQFESITEALASDLDVSPHLHSSSHTHHAQASASSHPRSSSQHHTHTSEHTTHSYSHDKTADAMPAMHKKLSLSSMTGLPRTGTPLPPHLSAAATPASLSSPISISELPPSAVEQEHGDARPRGHHEGREKGKEPAWPPAHGTLSRLSSSLVSAFLSGSPKHTRSNTSSSTSSVSGITPSSLPTASSDYVGSMPSTSPFAASRAITHGSPFASTPFIPPTGAPGFTGDRNWDKGFSDALLRERERGGVDVVGLGGEFALGEDRVGHEDGAGMVNGGDTVFTLKNAKSSPVVATKMKVKKKGVNLCGRREGTAEVLTEELANQIRPHLPALVRLSRTWTLLYSLDQHGISLNTLYTLCEPRIPRASEPNPPKGAIVVVKDSSDGVFGAWVGEGIRRGRGGYDGTGEAFLWRCPPDASSSLEVFHWTGKNDYVMLCEPEFISFGGGDGHYGLYIEASLLDGSSARCPTFDNPALCARPSSQSELGTGARDVSFECVGLEVWGVGPG